MSILIKGMEMPESGTYKVSIDKTTGKDKTVISMFVRGEGELICCGVYEVVPVPPHGRLGDLDAFESIKYELPDGQKAFNRGFHSGVQYVQRLIMDAPTIIEAEEGET